MISSEGQPRAWPPLTPLGSAMVAATAVNPAGLAASPAALVLATAAAIGAAAVLWPATHVRRLAIEAGQEQGVELREAWKRERARVGRVFPPAGQLNASLDHERVLDQALELTSEALIDPEDGPERLVGMLLLRAGGRARIVSGRGLPPGDWGGGFFVGPGMV